MAAASIRSNSNLFSPSQTAAKNLAIICSPCDSAGSERSRAAWSRLADSKSQNGTRVGCASSSCLNWRCSGVKVK